MKKITAFTFVVVLLSIGMVFAQEATQSQSVAQTETIQPVEVGNKHCPVTGQLVGQMGPVVKHEYNGKIYNLCCPMCHRTFDSDPEKYAKIAEDEAASQNK